MICGACSRDIPADGFYASNQATCRECVKQRATARNRQRPDRHSDATRRWRERERERTRLLELVLRTMAAWNPERFAEAVRDVEDAERLGAGAIEALFVRQSQKSRRLLVEGEATNEQDRADAA